MEKLREGLRRNFIGFEDLLKVHHDQFVVACYAVFLEDKVQKNHGLDAGV
jgi:hypothetical protein